MCRLAGRQDPSSNAHPVLLAGSFPQQKAPVRCYSSAGSNYKLYKCSRSSIG
jgi:hypothetical protein